MLANFRGFYGEVPERSKGADCKSAGEAFVGSIPTLSTGKLCGSNSVGRVTAFQAVCRGFESRLPLFLSTSFCSIQKKGRSACVAQSVEHILGKDEVTGSIPVVGSRCF